MDEQVVNPRQGREDGRKAGCQKPPAFFAIKERNEKKREKKRCCGWFPDCKNRIPCFRKKVVDGLLTMDE